MLREELFREIGPNKGREGKEINKGLQTNMNVGKQQCVLEQNKQSHNIGNRQVLWVSFDTTSITNSLPFFICNFAQFTI